MSICLAPLRAALPAYRPSTRPQRAAQLPAFTGLRAASSIPLQSAEASSSSLDAPQNGGRVFAMRHGNHKARLGRPADQRKALVRSLVTEVLRHGKITTTKTRAKAIRKYVDKMIGLAKDGSLHARRQALAFVYDGELVKNLFEQVPSRYSERNGGYCRVKAELMPRRGDNAELAIIELVQLHAIEEAGGNARDIKCSSRHNAAARHVAAAAKAQRKRKKAVPTSPGTKGFGSPDGSAAEGGEQAQLTSSAAAQASGSGPQQGSTPAAEGASSASGHAAPEAAAAAPAATPLPAVSREQVLTACVLVSLLIAVLGLGLHELAPHISPAVREGQEEAVLALLQWPPPPGLQEIGIGLAAAAAVTAARLALLAAWPAFREASDRSNEQASQSAALLEMEDALSPLGPADLLVVSLLPGLSEELLFRGALVPAIAPDWRGAVIAGLVFGALHSGGGRSPSGCARTMVPASGQRVRADKRDVGRWYHAWLMLVCADGAPFLLGLPGAMARLGWAGGLVALLGGFACILHSATRLVMLHELNGKRHTHLAELTREVFGKRLGRWAVLPFQLVVNAGTCVMYQVVSGQALHSLCLANRAAGCPRLAWWTVAFSASQLLLCLLPDINSLRLVTALGAATSLGFSTLATVGSLLRGQGDGASHAVEGSATARAFGAFSSLGGIFLLFGLTVLLEIQSTLAPAPTSAVPPMVRATVGGYAALLALFLAVACSGYWAFGASVEPIVLASVGRPTWLVSAGYICMVLNAIPSYLVFAHSLFNIAESSMMAGHWTGLGFRAGPRLLLKRLALRWAFVAATCGAALCLPYVNEVMGLVGALGYVPLCFVLPCLMWLQTQQGRLSLFEVGANWAVITLTLAVGLLAAVGSVRSLVCAFRSGAYPAFSS
eukprot:scaffold10.g2263.t1